MFFLANCSSNDKIETNFTVLNVAYDSVEKNHLAPSIRNTSEHIFTPLDLTLSRDFLIIIDANIAPAIHVIDRNNLNNINSFGREGRGPGEFLSPWTITTSKSDKKNVWVYDNILSRFSSFIIEMKTDSVDKANEALITLDSSEGRPVNAAMLNDSTIVSTGIFHERRIKYFNKDGGIKKSVGDLPHIEPSPSVFNFFTGYRKIPNNVLQHAYQSKIKSRPDGLYFAIATRHANLIEIYKHHGEKVLEIRGIKDDVPKIDIMNVQGNSVLNQGIDDFYFGYIDLKTSNSKIYGLYSGRKNADGHAYLGNEIHIFNWNGELLKILEFNQYLIAIEIDEMAGKIYGIEHYPDLSVNIYNFTHLN